MPENLIGWLPGVGRTPGNICYIRELIHHNRFSLHFVPGDDNITDLMTKGLKTPIYTCHITTISLPAEREC